MNLTTHSDAELLQLRDSLTAKIVERPAQFIERRLRRKRSEVDTEMANRWERYCYSKFVPYDHAHGYDRD
jgi:hypothetical protein